MPRLLLLVMLPILCGLMLYIVQTRLTKAFTIVVQIYLLLISIFFTFQLNGGMIDEALISSPLPYGMILRLDMLSAIMVILNNFLFLAMVIFSMRRSYMNRLFTFLFLSLQGLINAVFLSADIFNVYIVLEVATVAVSVLIMFKKDSQSMYDGMVYLLVNMVAMTFFLFGIGYLYKQFGVLDFDSIKAQIDLLGGGKSLYLPFSLLLTGIGLKAALMPLFSWLPKAHGTPSAPSAVSAILSGIFVKIGIYLIVRMQFIFQNAIDVDSLLLVMGFLTAILGFVFAIAQNDIKLILAYHTVSQIGLILIGISGALEFNRLGGIYHLLAHGLFKAALFLIAGILTEHYKTRKIKQMKGLWRDSKFLSITLLIAVAAITGAPFFSGGYAKYFISYGYSGFIFKALFIFINAGTMISFIKYLKVIFEPSVHKPTPLKIGANRKIVLIAISVITIALGVFGDQFVSVVSQTKTHLDLLAQLSKLPVYVLTYAVSYIVYKKLIEGRKMLDWVMGIELTFNGICMAITGFFFFTYVYLTAVA